MAINHLLNGMILQVHPQKNNMNTQNSGFGIGDALSNTAMFGIYAKFLGCTIHQVILRFFFATRPGLKFEFHAYILGKT